MENAACGDLGGFATNQLSCGQENDPCCGNVCARGFEFQLKDIVDGKKVKESILVKNNACGLTS